MSENEADIAHEVLEAFQDAIIAVGVAALTPLNKEQREYVIDKCHDEFRFWRIWEELK